MPIYHCHHMYPKTQILMPYKSHIVTLAVCIPLGGGLLLCRHRQKSSFSKTGSQDISGYNQIMGESWYVWLLFNFILTLKCFFIIRTLLDLIRYKVVSVVYVTFK